MNILFELGHPAHVHKYANTIKELEIHGNSIMVFAKNQPLIVRLLNHYGIPYVLAGEKKDGLIRKALHQLLYDWQCLRIAKRQKIDVMVGSIAVAHVSKLTGIPSILFDDDDDAVEPLMVKYAHPFFSTILSPEALLGTRKRKDTIYYSGYHELGYLHPKRFTPDPGVLTQIGIQPDSIFFIMRFNAFKAHHDVGVTGLSIEQKLALIKLLEKYGKVFITTERAPEPELSGYHLPVPAEQAHSMMAFATMFIGDSQTMTSEAAMLGVPSIRCNSFVGRISYLEEEEQKYGLTFGFLPDESEKMFAKIDELLSISGLREEWARRRERMLNDKIDVSAFQTWFIENYPKSKKIMRENPDYQYNFK